MLFEQRFAQTNVASWVERTGRFTALKKKPNQRTKPVIDKVIRAVRDLPIATRTWFRDPSAPWQEANVENTDRRARRWLP